MSSDITFFLEESCCEALQTLFLNDLFKLVATPDRADVIIFQEHRFDYIQQSPLFKQYPHKCLVLSQTFRPEFFVPGIYTNAYHHPLAHSSRVKAYGYFYYDTQKRNQYIAKYKEQDLTKKYLFSFIGGSTARVRRKIFSHYQGISDSYCVIDSTQQYFHWEIDQGMSVSQQQKQEEYITNVKESLFYLCPRGAGHNSIRLFEVMELGVAPVIIADGWMPSEGPNWSEFAIFVSEKDIVNIKTILANHKNHAIEMGKKARLAFDTYFSDNRHAPAIYRLINELIEERNPLTEGLIRTIFPIFNLYRQQKILAKDFAKKLIKGSPLGRLRIS